MGILQAPARSATSPTLTRRPVNPCLGTEGKATPGDADLPAPWPVSGVWTGNAAPIVMLTRAPSSPAASSTAREFSRCGSFAHASAE